MDRILVPGLPLDAHVGVTPAERATAQRIVVSLVLHVDLAVAGASDDLDHTVDYDAVCAAVAEVVARQPHHLIEAVAERVADAVLARFAVARVEVRVEKPGALESRGVPFAAVEIERAR